MQEQNSKSSVLFPEIGTKVKCCVLKSTFPHAILKIIEVEGLQSPIEYKAILKSTAFGEGVYICDKIKAGDLIDCFVISIGDSAIFVSQ